MKKYNVGIILFLLFWSVVAAQAGRPTPAPSAAPAPLIGAGLVYLATGGAAGAAWLLVRTIGKRLRKRKSQSDE